MSILNIDGFNGFLYRKTCFFSRISMTTRIKVFDLVLFILLTSVIFGIVYDITQKFNKQLPKAKEERIDWHDWELIRQDELRTGVGEHGSAAYLDLYPPYSKEINETIGYNGYLSDKIALNRSLMDLRPPE